MASAKLFGVGARYGVVFTLDTTTGLPVAASASATPEQGYQVEGIKTFSVNDPEAQRISHYGDDRVQAQDSLPPTEGLSATITTDKTNHTLDNALVGTKERTYTTPKAYAKNTNKAGSEFQVMFATYRQALDAVPTSSTFGKARQWEVKIVPSCRIVPKTGGFEQGTVDKTYEVTPTPVTATPWGEALNETNWGATESQIIEMVCDYQPRINVWKGNGTLTGFSLSHAPISTTYLKVWSNGTVATVTTLNTSDPSMTLSAAPGVDHQVFAIIQGTF